MIKKIFKLAIKNLIKQKFVSVINIVGLTISLCAIYIILAWVINELSYEKHHSKADRIYRFTVETGSYENNSHWHMARTHQIWRKKLPDYFPEIETMVELSPSNYTTVRIDNNSFYENIFCSDSNVFKIFDFEFISGNPNTALNDEYTLVISESFAKKYFPGTDPVGKSIEIEGSYINKDTEYTITGVYKDIPSTSHFHTNILAKVYIPENSNMTWAFTYILLKKNFRKSDITSKFQDFIKTHVPERQHKNLTGLHLTPLTDIHLKSHIDREIEPNGDIKIVKTFIFITIALFIIALINFINLLTASLKNKINNFKVQKVIGGLNRYNYFQLVIESGIIAFLSIFLALLIFIILSNFFGHIELLKNIEFNNIIQTNILYASLFVFVIIALSGIVPLLLVQVKKTMTLTSNQSSDLITKKAGYINKPLLVIQFTISIIVITCSLILNRQNKFIFSKNLGHNNNNIIMVNRNIWSEENQLMMLHDELKSNPVVKEICAVMDPPSKLIKDARQVKSSALSGEYSDYILTIFPTDETLFNFFDIPLVAGRNMDPYIEGQQYEQYVLNESAVKKLGIKNPEDAIGVDFTVKPYFSPRIIHGGTVVGVVKDFNFTSLYHPIQPMVFFQKPIWQWRILIKLAPGNFGNHIDAIKKSWGKIFPEYPFEYEMLSDIYNKAYKKDILTYKTLSLFSILCLIISAFGLLGITSILLINKTKEIGVRKVNGAKNSEILALINLDFIKWIILSILIACPLSWLTMNRWLENYTEHIAIKWWFFIISSTVGILIALITISIQSWKVTLKNPVEALRYE